MRSLPSSHFDAKSRLSLFDCVHDHLEQVALKTHYRIGCSLTKDERSNDETFKISFCKVEMVDVIGVAFVRFQPIKSFHPRATCFSRTGLVR